MNARSLAVLALALALGACTRTTRGDGGPGDPAADPAPATETAGAGPAAETGKAPEPPRPGHGADVDATKIEEDDGGMTQYKTGLPTDLEEWRIHDNGTRCMTYPCPSWTGERDGEEVRFTGVDLSPLGLSKEKAAEVKKELYRGDWIVRGRLVGGPMGPAGAGRVMQVVKLLRKAPAEK